jgi:hypothetical protein
VAKFIIIILSHFGPGGPLWSQTSVLAVFTGDLYDVINFGHLVSVMQHIRGAYCLLMMDAVCTSEMSVCYEPTWRNIPEGYHLHTWCQENLKSHTDVGLLNIFIQE